MNTNQLKVHALGTRPSLGARLPRALGQPNILRDEKRPWRLLVATSGPEVAAVAAKLGGQPPRRGGAAPSGWAEACRLARPMPEASTGRDA